MISPELKLAIIFLATAVLAVPIARRTGLGSVLGYLLGGCVIGPSGFGLVSEVENIRHFSELGVVLLLFVIGLELKPARLWALRKPVFGLGGAQVLVTGAVLGAIAWRLGLSIPASVVIGIGLSMSSTAMILQLLAERNELSAQHGRSGFAILLFQDLAVIPLLALMPLFSERTGQIDPTGPSAAAIPTVIALVLGGRILLRPLFRAAAGTALPEIFTASALLVVVGSALLMQLVGLSMALGAFLAGVLLADSEYRHELQADIEPFKGLLLGLFFIAVGMSADLRMIIERPQLIATLVVGLLVVKSVALFLIARAFSIRGGFASRLAIYLSQGGEFAFVLFTLATGDGIMVHETAELLIVTVTVSMAMTPLLILILDWVQKLWMSRLPPRPFDTINEPQNKVIIAGFGRFGQIIGRILRVRHIGFTALEASPSQVDFVRRFGSKVYYGDASRIDLLRAANADKASVLVLAVDDMAASLRTAETVRKHFPRLRILARARNRRHAHLLMDLGIDVFVRETYFSSLELAVRVLRTLGDSEQRARDTVKRFRQHDEATLIAQHAIHDDEAKLIQTAKDAALELEHLFEADTEAERSQERADAA